MHDAITEDVSVILVSSTIIIESSNHRIKLEKQKIIPKKIRWSVSSNYGEGCCNARLALLSHAVWTTGTVSRRCGPLLVPTLPTIHKVTPRHVAKMPIICTFSINFPIHSAPSTCMSPSRGSKVERVGRRGIIPVWLQVSAWRQELKISGQ